MPTESHPFVVRSVGPAGAYSQTAPDLAAVVRVGSTLRDAGHSDIRVGDTDLVAVPIEVFLFGWGKRIR